MSASSPIIIDTNSYQRAALVAVRHALTQSHGSSFATEFVREHRLAIYGAARTRVCGRSDAFLFQDGKRLATALSPA